MDCPKCNGLLALELLSDFFLIFRFWKCFNCGAVIDRTIAKNRRHSLTTQESQPRGPLRRRPPISVS